MIFKFFKKITARKKQKGFTLIELLVVISIIGLLSGIVLVSVQDARARARDGRRKQDLAQAVKAVEFYNLDKGSYVIDGSGYLNGGEGWFNYEDEGVDYVRSIARALVEDGGKVKTIIKDPSGGVASSPTVGYAYMLYRCGDGFFVYAKLEKPTAGDLASCNVNSCCDSLQASYGMNYAVGHK